MVDVNRIQDALAAHLNRMGKGEFKVRLETDYSKDGLDTRQPGTASMTLVLDNPELETNSLLAQEALAKLSEIKALGDNVQFESPQKHAENLGKQLKEFIAQGADIPESFGEWFARQGEKEGKPHPDHALEIQKSDVGIKVKIRVPEGEDATHIARKMEENKASIIEGLAKRTAKYWNAESKAGIEEQIKNLDFAITSEKNEYNNSITIEIRSKAQLEKVKNATDKWNIILTGDEPKNLRASNPLSTLPDGDGKTTESPALLQKALARAILFDDKTPRDYFVQIAGNKDMQIAVAKSLVKLKQEKTDIEPKVDAFLNDPIFKEHDKWHGHGDYITVRNSKNGDEKGIPKIQKINHSFAKDAPDYVAGRVKIEIPLPSSKFDTVMNELASAGNINTMVNASVAAAGAAASAPEEIAAQEQQAQEQAQLASAETRKWQAAIGETLSKFTDKASQPSAGASRGA